MKPVVARPDDHLRAAGAGAGHALTDEASRAEVHDQFVAKLQRKRRVLQATRNAERFADAGRDGAAGASSTSCATWTPQDARDWLAGSTRRSPTFLDRGPASTARRVHRLRARRRVASASSAATATASRSRRTTWSRSARFVAENLDTIPALLVVTQRPRDLTRQQLQELKLALDAGRLHRGEPADRLARDDATRTSPRRSSATSATSLPAQPLLPYKSASQAAMQTILASRPWTAAAAEVARADRQAAGGRDRRGPRGARPRPVPGRGRLQPAQQGVRRRAGRRSSATSPRRSGRRRRERQASGNGASDTQDIVAKLWNLCHVLRDDGITYSPVRHRADVSALPQDG